MLVDKGNQVRAREFGTALEEAKRKREIEMKSTRPVRRTSAGLRNALFDEIDALRDGSGDPQRAMAIAKLASNILQTANLEFKFKQAGFPEKEEIKAIILGDGSEDDQGT